MKNPIIMHINYCEQGQTLDEVCRKAVDWGFDGVEFRSLGAAYPLNEQDRYLDAVAKAKKESGLKMAIFGYEAYLLDESAEKRAAETAKAIEFLKSCLNRFSLTVINAFAGFHRNPDPKVTYGEFQKNGSFCADAKHFQWAAEGYKQIGAFAAANHFKLAFETHMVCLHDTPDATKKLVDMVGMPSVGVNLDYGNAVNFEKKHIKPLDETIKMLGNSLYYVHLKNSSPLPGMAQELRLRTALSEGEINHREYIRLLDQSGYQGPICIEAPRAGDREWYAVQDLAYIKTLLRS